MSLDVANAVSHLRSEIARRGFAPGMIEEIAEEWGVRPELLARKFKEVTGRDPETLCIVDMKDKLIEHAKALAAEWAKSSTGLECSGVLFTTCTGRRMISVAWTGTELNCINIETQERWTVSFHENSYAYAFMRKHGIWK